MTDEPRPVVVDKAELLAGIARLQRDIRRMVRRVERIAGIKNTKAPAATGAGKGTE